MYEKTTTLTNSDCISGVQKEGNSAEIFNRGIDLISQID